MASFKRISAAFAIALAVTLAFLPDGSASAATASWSFEPATWDFGAVIPESGATTNSFTLVNTGETGLTPGIVTLSSSAHSGFALAGNTCGSPLAAGSTCTVKVKFEPPGPGNRTAELSMLESHSAVPPAVASLSGNGAGPAASFSEATLNFGRILLGTTPPTRTEVLTNSGLLDLSITSVHVETNAFAENDFRDQFRLGAGTTCASGVVLPPDGSCSVDVEFTPTEPFRTEGHLVIADNTLESPHRIELDGAGTNIAPFVPHTPEVVRYKGWVSAVGWGYAGTRGQRVLLARVAVTSCTRNSIPTFTARTQERPGSAVVTLLAHRPAEERLEGSGCQKVKTRRVVPVRLKRPVIGLALYDGSQKHPIRRGPRG